MQKQLQYRYHSKSLASNLVSAIKVFFPALAVFWLFFYSYAKAVPTTKLRGSQSFEVPMPPPGDKSQTLMRKSTEVRRKIIVPHHAIIVAGHAVVRLNQMTTADKSDAAWYLLPYQLNQGFPTIIKSHIQKGIELSNKDVDSILLFSGGQTRKDTGPLSEAASYYYLAEEKRWMSDNLKSRVYLEEFARDSYENLLFSICRFYEIVGSYPTKITVIGFDFKDHRFTDLHRAAIGFPIGNFTYVGMKPKNTNFLHSKAISGELIAASQFRKDMYGCSNPSLMNKRIVRNPFKRTIPYVLSCPDIKDLLTWCGPELFDWKILPWAISKSSNSNSNSNSNEGAQELNSIPGQKIK